LIIILTNSMVVVAVPSIKRFRYSILDYKFWSSGLEQQLVFDRWI
jgi:hypothetical protein